MLTPSSSVARYPALLRGLCIVVFLAMLLAVGYAAWISIANFGRIGV